ERAAEDLQYRIARTRLEAMDTGVAYAFTYRPENDQFMTWACEPLNLTPATLGGQGSASVSATASGDAYNRRYFELNDKPDSREFRFLNSDLTEPLAGMGLSYEARASLGPTGSAGVAGSSLLSQRKLALATASTRSIAALQIPALQLGDVAQPIVFEPD